MPNIKTTITRVKRIVIVALVFSVYCKFAAIKRLFVV